MVSFREFIKAQSQKSQEAFTSCQLEPSFDKIEKPSKSVVFDASCSFNGIYLNYCLYLCPNLSSKILGILLWFRSKIRL